MASLLPTINLPLPILLHAAGLTLLGLHITFYRKPSTPLLGIASLGLGVAYLATSYMPVAENQWLHASVPVRMILGAVAGVRAFIAKDCEATRELIGVLLYDGLGGLLLGWSLGRWDGKVAGY